MPDATVDPRFAENPLVTSEPDIRFYAGATLKLGDGTHAGTLCVLDRRARTLDETQREVLGHLALGAVRMLEGRRALRSERELRARMAAARAALAESEARFRVLCDVSPLGVFAAWARPARAGVEFDKAFRTRHADDAERFVHARARATVDASGRPTGYVGSVEDVAESRTPRNLQTAEQRRMAGIIEGTGAGTWEWNVQTGQIRVNEQWAAIVGHTLDEMGPVSIGSWLSRVHPEDLERSGELLSKHFSGETERYECEARVRHRDGHWVWVLGRGRVLSWTPDGKPEWMFGTHLDITARKLQEDALRKSEALLNRTGELAGIGGWELDLVAGTLMWTPQTRVIHGVSPDFVPTLDTAIDFYAPEARPVIQAAVERAMATGEAWDLELPLVRADGRALWVRAVGNAELENGKPVRLLGGFQDITQRRALHEELAEQHELLRVTLQSIGDAVITTDRHGRVTWLNPVAERMTGWLNAEAKGHAVGRVFHVIGEETRSPTENPVTACLQKGTAAGRSRQTLLISRHGEQFGIEDSSSPIRNEVGEIFGVVLVFRDVTEQRRLSGEMTYRATHDALTGLMNRTEFETRLQRVLTTAHEERSEHALMYIDLDQFKRVNDTCGHSVGDRLLQHAARLLRESVRARDTVARLGGDEFAVILEHCSAEQAQRVAHKICERMEEFRFVHDDKRFRIGASIGLVPVDPRWSMAAAVMQAADTSCYAAKEAGRNRVHLWFDTDQTMRARQGEMHWASRIEQALDEDGFELYAQRITRLAEPDPDLYAEVLLRMRDPGGALVMPDAFLPAAERFHLSTRVDRWVLKQVVRRLKRHGDLSGLSSLSVNLSGQSIGDRAFHRQVMEILGDAGEAVCRRLCLEITETVAVTNIADAAAFVEQVRALGIRVALDDFGAGASSFGYLKSLSVDVIKIDGRFIRDVVDDPLDEAAVRGFVDVARVVGVRTVAEFVDRPAVLERVKELGIDFAQGHLLHRPQPLDELLAARPAPVPART